MNYKLEFNKQGIGPNIIFHNIISVSYTHLDVYKRQDLIFERSKKENIKIPNFTIPLYYSCLLYTSRCV